MKYSNEIIVGIANLSDFPEDTGVAEYVDPAFDKFNGRWQKRQMAKLPQYRTVWEKLKKPENPDIEGEILRRLTADEEETVLVGINNKRVSSSFRISLDRRRLSKNYLLPGLAVRQIAEKDPFSDDQAGVLVGVRVKRE